VASLPRGTRALRVCGVSGLCAVKPYNFTFGLEVDLQPLGHGRRYCYEFANDAEQALAAWDGNEHPSGPWIKCKGATVELLNPAFGREASAS
jgi:hypothetical protein